jgi:hypothetical protein
MGFQPPGIKKTHSVNLPKKIPLPIFQNISRWGAGSGEAATPGVSKNQQADSRDFAAPEDQAAD